MATMNKRDRKYLNLLFDVAQESEPVSGARVAACLVFKKTLVIIGTNQYRTDPWAARFAKNDEADSIHAEVQAIKNAVNHFRGEKYARDQIAQATLYICRAKRMDVGGEWTWGMAKPCEGCMGAIEEFGIKKVIYSDEGVGNFGEL